MLFGRPDVQNTPFCMQNAPNSEHPRSDKAEVDPISRVNSEFTNLRP